VATDEGEYPQPKKKTKIKDIFEDHIKMRVKMKPLRYLITGNNKS
jgi:hypothetical protein